MAEDIAVRLAEVESRSKSNTHRLDKMEEQTQAIQSLATSVAVMANKQDNMDGKLDKLGDNVSDIMAKPGKRWEYVVEKALYFVLAAVLTYVLCKVGLPA